MVKSYLQVELVKKGNHEMAESHFLKSPVNRKHAFKKIKQLDLQQVQRSISGFSKYHKTKIPSYSTAKCIQRNDVLHI